MLRPVDQRDLRAGDAVRFARLGRLHAALTADHSAKAADDANECAARGTWITLGCALLVAAGAAYHSVFFAQLRHRSSQVRQQHTQQRPISCDEYRGRRATTIAPSLESPGPEQVEAELAGSLLLYLTGVRARAGQITRARLYAGLRRVDGVEPVFELESEILDEIARVYDAQPCAESDEPLIPDLLAEDRAGIEQIVVTNTIPLNSKAAELKKIKVLSIAPLLAKAIKSIHEETSVSSLFV